MKLTIASVLAFASSAFAALSINNPVAGTVWSSDGKPVTVSWISDDGSPLTGTVSVELMEGTDQNNLKSVVNIASNIDATVGDLTFTPPTDLTGSKYYAVRVTSSVDGMHYSHSFQAGDASITAAVSESDSAESNDSSGDEESDDSKTGKNTDDESSSGSTNDDSESEESTDGTDTDTDSKSEKDVESKTDSTDKESSKEETSSEDTEDTDSTESDSETEETEETESSSSEDEDTGGASRPAIAIGLLGLIAFVSMF
ncbi:hypothetical protein COEREDRAFT_82743 [Coemansia reversa NRRL 1564]|uniref:Yeast cell wall synthesis Kre9/Knh1-like N-terminal domain-containing protein n=1 Tax=Coemansia reversa (strain ATCC 12441 / NRRL 1564) TaxID=763665 RepID=A0A2G5B645_COERN|nr:hypothetical protein COEREDRAFT_82743 [Coemansia reversa NRRL 1564]|eukprot:PIA14471.1 hypothetical protein COEREDRAFT_82743 [Coemansia reversa NRRL 1564]